MDKEKYLNKLRELKDYLSLHPEQKIIYGDLRINQTILSVKRDIYYEEERKQSHVQDRLYTDGFTHTSYNPFE